MKRIILPIAILIGCVLISGFLIRNPTTVEEAAVEIIPVSVRVAEVNLESVDLIVGSQGKVQAAQTVSLSAPVAGPVEWISPSMEAGGDVGVVVGVGHVVSGARASRPAGTYDTGRRSDAVRSLH